MNRTLFFSLLFIIYIAIDIYVYRAFVQIFGGQKWVIWTYWAITVLCFLAIYSMTQYNTLGQVRNPYVNIAFGLAIAVFFYKLLFALFLLVQDTSRYVFGGAYKLVDSSTSIPSRRKFLTSTAAFVLGLPLAGSLYGLTRGKYNYTVEHARINTPQQKGVKGFKIAHISDIHAGTFDSLDGVQKGIDMIMAQKPDIIVFTGDLVNDHIEEMEPYVEIFGQLSAPYGMYACTGNHDYYARHNYVREGKGSQSDFMDTLEKLYDTMGFQLLNNASKTIQYMDHPINIIGVENWGRGPFPKKGDLSKATADIDQDGYNILLSHDPTHWEDHVKNYSTIIDLTMSGHTHGMQLGIKYKDFKWSPAQYRYKCWMGLYEENGRHLYVNRGYGCLGFPGRVGMEPEISILELA